jgi:1,4-dihydroxy-2-naphthoate polyprenyltransferase
VRLGRPEFLVGGFVMHGLGVALARSVGVPIDLVPAAWCQMAITTIQLTVHYCNEYFDLEADRANPTPTRWSGGSRVLVDGTIAPRVALITALLLAVLAVKVILVLALIVRPSPITAAMFLGALGLAWSYSAPPLRLHSRGLGEATTALLVPGLATLAGFYVQVGRLELLPFLVAAPLCLLQVAMLVLIELPDAAGDAAVGKRTLVVRLGLGPSQALYVGLLVATYLALPVLLAFGLPPVVAAADVLGLPLAVWLAWRVRGCEPHAVEGWDTLEFAAIALFMGTAVADLAAMLLLGI